MKLSFTAFLLFFLQPSQLHATRPGLSAVRADTGVLANRPFELVCPLRPSRKPTPSPLTKLKLLNSHLSHNKPFRMAAVFPSSAMPSLVDVIPKLHHMRYIFEIIIRLQQPREVDSNLVHIAYTNKDFTPIHVNYHVSKANAILFPFEDMDFLADLRFKDYAFSTKLWSRMLLEVYPEISDMSVEKSVRKESILQAVQEFASVQSLTHEWLSVNKSFPIVLIGNTHFFLLLATELKRLGYMNVNLFMVHQNTVEYVLFDSVDWDGFRSELALLTAQLSIRIDQKRKEMVEEFFDFFVGYDGISLGQALRKLSVILFLGSLAWIEIGVASICRGILKAQLDLDHLVSAIRKD